MDKSCIINEWGCSWVKSIGWAGGVDGTEYMYIGKGKIMNNSMVELELGFL